MRNLILIDNHYSTGAFLAKEENEKLISISNSKIYGELDELNKYTPDCIGALSSATCAPDPNSCDRFAIIMPIFPTHAFWPLGSFGGATDHIDSDAVWGGKTYIEDIEFISFKSKDSKCGGV